LKYSSIFSDEFLKKLQSVENISSSRVFSSPDSRDGKIYVFSDELILAVEIALVTGRPLLLRGEPGSGKSSFAAFIARKLNWRYYEHVVTAQTNAQDFLWSFDAVRRLSDAQANKIKCDAEYVQPGVLWWLFDNDSARTCGRQLPEKSLPDPNEEINEDRDLHRAVILIDEIDKADPEVPNALLVPLGSNTFHIPTLNVKVNRLLPENKSLDHKFAYCQLVIITTNEERELPPAFLRRCIIHTLQHPNNKELLKIAEAHMSDILAQKDPQRKLCNTLIEKLITIREEAYSLAQRAPSTAEFLDALKACLEMEISLEDDTWEKLKLCTLTKETSTEQGHC